MNPAELLRLGAQFRTLRASGRYELDGTVLRDRFEQTPPRNTIVGVVMGPMSNNITWSAVMDHGPPLRWRVDRPGTREIANGTTVTVASGDQATRIVQESSRGPGEPLGRVLQPWQLATLFEFGEASALTRHGRKAISAIGVARDLPGLSAPDLGDHLRVLIDLDRALVVQWQSWWQGQDLAEFTIDNLDFDTQISDQDLNFTPTPGMRVRTEEDLKAEFRQRQRSRQADTSDLLSQHVPRGPGPTDEAEATEAIRRAIENLATTTDDGEDAPNVQAGDGLGPACTQAQSRHAGVTLRLITHRFLSHDEAVVVFAPEGGPGPIQVEGRVLRINERWVVERATAARLLRRAGAHPPPPTA